MPPEESTSLEDQIARWRGYLERRQAIHAVDVAELEDHLREQVDRLTEGGLNSEEAFLIAVKRMGDMDSLSREFAREHSERLWKQLVLSPADQQPDRGLNRDAVVAIGLAILAGVLIKLPSFAGFSLEFHSDWYARNISLFVLPLLAGYFVHKRGLAPAIAPWLAGAFVLSAVVMNAYPFFRFGQTEVLATLHLPVVLWLIVGVAYAGERWTTPAGRMDFIRFSGEVFIYYVLIALGGGVLTAFMLLIFQSAGVDASEFFGAWVLPCGAVGALIIAAWLVEAKQSVIENMAPVLARIFTPLFAIALITFLGVLLWTGRGVAFQRDLLIAFDLLLVVVLGLLLYSLSARDSRAPANIYDVLQVILLVSALAADAVALSSIAVRITDMGFTPNRIAALGLNVLLLVNLAWSAWLYIRFLRGQGEFASLERWQTGYLPLYAAWSAIVVLVFPPVFAFA